MNAVALAIFGNLFVIEGVGFEPATGRLDPGTRRDDFPEARSCTPSPSWRRTRSHS
jgi:hypothetical protein